MSDLTAQAEVLFSCMLLVDGIGEEARPDAIAAQSWEAVRRVSVHTTRGWDKMVDGNGGGDSYNEHLALLVKEVHDNEHCTPREISDAYNAVVGGFNDQDRAWLWSSRMAALKDDINDMKRQKGARAQGLRAIRDQWELLRRPDLPAAADVATLNTVIRLLVRLYMLWIGLMTGHRLASLAHEGGEGSAAGRMSERRARMYELVR